MQNNRHLYNHATEDETAVRKLLHSALDVRPTASPGFRAAVWARIDALGHPRTWAQWLRGHLVGVASATVVCVLLAVAGGGWLALQQKRALRQQQLIRYVVSIDAHQRLFVEDNSTPHSQNTFLK